MIPAVPVYRGVGTVDPPPSVTNGPKDAKGGVNALLKELRYIFTCFF